MFREFIKRCRFQISKILYVYLLSVIIFLLFLKEIQFDIFLTVYMVFLGLMLAVLEHKSNAKYIFEMMILGTVVSGGYIVTKLLTGHIVITAFFHCAKYRMIIVTGILFEYLYILGLQIANVSCVCNARNEDKHPEQGDLFPEREDDIERLSRYIEIFHTIGIQGGWGSGKTYLVDEYIKRNEEKYEVIRVETLTCNLDTVDSYIFKQLEAVLWRNGIYPRYSRQIQTLLEDNKILRKFQSIFYKGGSDRMTAFEGFCKDIKKLSKIILLVCEDIDRISENYVDQIAKILDISTKLSGNNVKVIYEYDQKKMTELGFKKDYMEKYIPHVINLTNVSFMNLIYKALEEEKELNGKLCGDNFKFLTYPIYMDHFLTKLFGFKFDLALRLSGIEPRKIKEFVSEVNLVMRDEKYVAEENKKVIIIFHYIKIFMWDFFDELSFFDDLQEEVMFERRVIENGILKSYYYNVMELIHLLIYEKITEEDIRQMFVSGNNEREEEYIVSNRNKLGILLLLEFDFKALQDIYDKRGVKKNKHGRNPILDEDMDDIQRIERNSKINKLIKNLYMNGKSEYTDNEANARLFIYNVLYSEDNQRKVNWIKYINQCYHSQIYKDNSTIFMFMGDRYLSLAKALKIVINMPEFAEKKVFIKSAFLDFWMDNIGTEESNIMLEQVKTFRFIEPESDKDFVKAINFFNSLKVCGKMNTERAYVEFLNTYVNTAYRLGYIYNYYYYDEIKEFADLEDKKGEILKEILEEISGHLNRDLENKNYPTSVEENIQKFNEFLRKNLNIIGASEKDMWNKPEIKTKISEKENYKNKDVFLGLKSIAETQEMGEEDYRRLLDEEYDNKNINLLEYRRLMKMWSKP